ncbi:hypothetical protein KBC79_02215 [Candidatus Woesebacteria bacterium]|nr:hypothetical protein [Candidatus Woesebacteria bacterium]
MKDIAPRKYAPNLFDILPRTVRKGDLWSVDVFPVLDSELYDFWFGEQLAELGVESFPELFSEIMRTTKSCHVLDLMGGAYFLKPEEYSRVSSVTGFRLGNPESKYIENIAAELQYIHENPEYGSSGYLQQLKSKAKLLSLLRQEPKRAVVYGSLYDKDAWSVLDASMSGQNIESINVAIVRPLGPFLNNHLTDEQSFTDREKIKYAAVFTRVSNELLSRINRNLGFAFVQIPQLFPKVWIEAWAKKMETRFGCSVRVALNKKYTEQYKNEQFVALFRFEKR